MSLLRFGLALGLLPAASVAFGGRVVLGKLGQALEPTLIHTTMNSHSRAYYKLRAYEYVVLKPTNKKQWLMVLMQNGAYGYVVSGKVATLPYEVTTEKPVASRSTPVLPSRSGAQLAKYALNFVGTPYKWGGNDPWSGIDCSGFVKRMFGAIGVNLPRTAAEQVNVGEPITRYEDLKAGDRLYFWDHKRGKVGHTGIYLGGGYFVHSSMGHRGVATDYLSEKWQKLLVAARR